jgi:hypothetical protein
MLESKFCLNLDICLWQMGTDYKAKLNSRQCKQCSFRFRAEAKIKQVFVKKSATYKKWQIRLYLIVLFFNPKF